MAVSSSNCEIQSANSTSGSRRNGRYFDLSSGSSSVSEMASWGHCASVRSCLDWEPIRLKRLVEALAVKDTVGEEKDLTEEM
jgi:hypothetical protein